VDGLDRRRVGRQLLAQLTIAAPLARVLHFLGRQRSAAAPFEVGPTGDAEACASLLPCSRR
jgi:hypothetical protein